jgi:hypothetical protein
MEQAIGCVGLCALVSKILRQQIERPKEHISSTATNHPEPSGRGCAEGKLRWAGIFD